MQILWSISSLFLDDYSLSKPNFYFKNMARKVEIFVGFTTANSWWLFLLAAQSIGGESPSLAAQAQAINRIYFTHFSYVRTFPYSDLIIGFHSIFKSLKSFILKEKTDPKCAQKLSFSNWHTRRIFVPHTSLMRSIQSGMFILFPLFSSVKVECVQV